jgi:hypothetical protein
MKRKVFLPLVTSSGSMRMKFFHSLMNALKALPEWEVSWAEFSNGVYVNRARNCAVAQFLRESELGDALVFIDLDIVFTPADLRRLLESKHGIVGGLYYLKRQEERQACARLMTPIPNGVPFGEVVEAMRVGTGFLKIERSVLEGLSGVAKGYKHYCGNQEWDIFCQPISEEGELLSEDWGFCDLARGHGFRVMLDTGIRLQHEGYALYPI